MEYKTDAFEAYRQSREGRALELVPLAQGTVPDLDTASAYAQKAESMSLEEYWQPFKQAQLEIRRNLARMSNSEEIRRYQGCIRSQLRALRTSPPTKAVFDFRLPPEEREALKGSYPFSSWQDVRRWLDVEARTFREEFESEKKALLQEFTDAFSLLGLAGGKDSPAANAPLLKFQWKGTPTQLAVVLNLLVAKGYIEEFATSGEGKARVALAHFKVQGNTSSQSLGRIFQELNRDENPLNADDMAKLQKFPHRKDLKKQTESGRE